MKSLLLTFSLLIPAAAAGADFTFIAPGARPAGMGSAFSSVADDPFTVFYNPAGLSGMPYLEVKGGAARRLSSRGPMGDVSLAYVRPVPGYKTRVAGAAYHAVRFGGGDMDTAVFGIGDSFVMKYFQKPISWGANFRVSSLRYPDKSNLGIAGDAGVLLDTNYGLKTGVTLSGLGFGFGRSMASLTLGNSYRFGDTVLALDFRARGSYSEFLPGVEHTALNGLLQLRAGKGLSLYGGEHVAFGVGFNVSPWTVDFAASLPWKGFHESAGFYEVSFGYRFGAPGFAQRLAGDAAERVSTARKAVDDMRAQRAGLENSIATYEANKGVLESELTLLQTRIREQQARLKDLELQIIEAQYKKEAPPPPKRPALPPKPEKWPRLHKVAPGDTLRSIAAQHYGNPNLWERVYEFNRDKVVRGIPAEGSVLQIPAPPPEKKD